MPADMGQQLRVGFVLLESFTLNAFSGFIEAMRLSADKGGRSRQIACGWEIMGGKDVTASCGLKITPTSELADPGLFDYIAVCGGNGYLERQQPRWLDDYLHRAADAGTPLIGLCTGTFNIARAGLMEGYVACVHWNVFEAFKEQFPHIRAVPDRIFVHAGDRISCAGSAGACDLALHLITQHCGHEKAQQSIRHMMLQGVRPSTHPQAHFYGEMQNVRDSAVRRVVHLMEQSLNEPPQVPELARQAGISPRQLDRRFIAELNQTPSRYFRDMRLRYGAWLLTHTTDKIAQIAVDTGFADAAHFSRAFRALYSTTPQGYRTAMQPESRNHTDPSADITKAARAH